MNIARVIREERRRGLNGSLTRFPCSSEREGSLGREQGGGEAERKSAVILLAVAAREDWVISTATVNLMLLPVFVSAENRQFRGALKAHHKTFCSTTSTEEPTKWPR